MTKKGLNPSALDSGRALEVTQKKPDDPSPLHDPVAVARVIDPTIVHCEDFPVAIETGGEHTAGATVVDLHHLSGQPDNTHVALSLDRDRFWGTMIEAIRSYG